MKNSKPLENSDEETGDFLYHLHRWTYFSGMLAEQCNDWLSAKEGDENVLKEYREKEKL